MQRHKLLNLKNLGTKALKELVSVHKDKIKAAALPVVIGLAVIFFWFYGAGGEEPELKDNAVQPAEKLSETAEKYPDGGATGEIFVDIDGAVNKPGVYKVSEGTRLFQVIELAGGLTDDASTQSLNRAEAVYDGQKITVYSSDTEGYSQDDMGGGVPAEKGITGGKVNINTADSVTLKTIPGIGPSKAARIIEYRESQGRFKKIDDIKNVTGIGDMTFENIKGYITV